MSDIQYPYQPDFIIEEEPTGKLILEDGTSIETRVIMSDLTIVKADVLGYEYAVKTVVALRAKATDGVKEQFKDKPMQPPGSSIPLTEEAGYEPMEVTEVVSPTKSKYTFNGKTVISTLNIQKIARNNNYKTISNSPLYNVRWRVETEIEG